MSISENHLNIFNVTTGLDNIVGSLRDAVNKANALQSNNTVEIIITPAVNHIILTSGEIIISSNIKIINNSQKLIITSNSSSRIFHIVSLSNYLQIKSKYKPAVIKYALSISNGGAIYIEPDNHTLILKNIIMKYNHSKLSGGAIYTMGVAILYSSKIESNLAASQGAGIYSNLGVQLYKSHVANNKITTIDVSSGGAGLFIDNGTCIVDESYINHNSVIYDDSNNGGSGGGIVVMTGSLFVQNNSQVSNNSAFNSGGIQQGIGDVTITNSSVNRNVSFDTVQGSGGGGGISISLGTVTISNSKICDNRTVGMFSGGIVSLVGDVVVNNSSIQRNSNRGPGGGIALNVGSAVIEKTYINDNIGASLGGGIASFTPDPNYLHISNSHITNNTLTNAEIIKQTIAAFLSVVTSKLSSNTKQAEKSGGNGSTNFINNVPIIIQKLTEVFDKLKELDIIENNIAGGAIACLLSTAITIDNSIIKKNFSGQNVSTTNYPFNAHAGGIFGTNINIINSKICNNKALNHGGGIFVKGFLNISDSDIIKNEAQHGGGIFNDNKSQTITSDVDISNNFANKTGGGVTNKGSLKLILSKITDNRAGKNGGGLITNNSIIKINTIIKNNSPNNIDTINIDTKSTQ